MAEDRYDIISPIGSGGLGTVYKARDTQLNRYVAIKRLKSAGERPATSDEQQKLLDEASLTGAVQHPNIVSVYDGGVDHEGAFLVMEFVDGETLNEVFQNGALTIHDFVQIATQIQEGLVAAQNLQLLHRDLKPGNIMISWLPSGSYRVKILDFGMAKFAPTPMHQTADHDQAIYGAVHFMAPEQFNRMPLDVRTDLYAMGCILYLGLTGILPFQGDNPAEIMKAHLQGRVIPVHYVRKDLPRPLAEWLMTLLARDMDERPDNAEQSLEHFQAGIEKAQALETEDESEDAELEFQHAG